MISTVLRPHRGVAGTVIRLLVVVDGVTFLFFALLHLGIRLQLGPMVLTTGRIISATVVEGLIGILFAVGAYAVFTRASSAWTWTVLAHVFGIAGVLVGLWAIAAGLGPPNELNDTYHRVILAILVVGLILLLTPPGRVALGQGDVARASRPLLRHERERDRTDPSRGSIHDIRGEGLAPYARRRLVARSTGHPGSSPAVRFVSPRGMECAAPADDVLGTAADHLIDALRGDLPRWCGPERTGG